MNRYLSCSKTMVIMFLLVIVDMSWGMNKTFEFENLLPESQIIVINRLDDPLRFGKTCKAMHAIVKREGKRNLERLYKNQRPDFVHDFLLSHYVPIILVNDSVVADNKIMHFFSVDPYEKSFYAQPQTQLFDKKIIACGDKRLECELEQKRIKYDKFSVAHTYSRGGPLIEATLFGSNEDIEQELKDNIYSNSDFVMDGAFKAAISCPHDKNNALQVLLEHVQRVGKSNSKKQVTRSGISLWNLLYLARKVGNKTASQFLCDFLKENSSSK